MSYCLIINNVEINCVLFYCLIPGNKVYDACLSMENEYLKITNTLCYDISGSSLKTRRTRISTTL